MADMYSSYVLTGVVRSLVSVPQFLLDRYFPTTQTEMTEEIHFDLEEERRRIAPFVSPLVEGQIVASKGYITKVFSPAYIKDKRVIDMARPFRRAAGENFGGTMSPMQRLRAHIASELADQRNMIDRRLEVMAALTIANGKITISGEKYPPVLVDFQRAVSHTVTASPLWSDITNSKPLTDLTTWGAVALQDTGVMLMDVIMSPAAYQAFKANAQVTSEMSLYRRANDLPSLAPGRPLEEGGVYMGQIDQFNIWIYAGWYVDPADNVEKQIWPNDKLVMTSPLLNGVRCFGAIRDERAGLQPMEYFPKSWVQEDPSVRYLLMQSAPLLVPYRINASMSAKVL